MSRSLSLFLILAAIFLTASCNEGTQTKPTASGMAGEVAIVMDKPNWEGEMGATFRASLAAEFPFLPQAEPVFTLFNVPHNAFNALFQSHRNLVIVSISPEYEVGTMVIQENVWAAPQIVATFSGPNASEILACFDQQKERLINAIEQAERNRVIAVSKRYEERTLRLLVNESFGGSPRFPQDYFLKKQAKNFIWITRETTNIIQGILVYSYPYVDSTSLSKEVMIRESKRVMREQVPGATENSYMVFSQVIEPDLRWIHYSGQDFGELRGLWDVQNDYMGGPFVSHFYLDVSKRQVLVLHGFVYAPRYDKRNYVRQIESILYSFEWEGESE